MKLLKEYIVPVILLCIFVLLMISTDFLKSPMGEDDDVIKKIKEIETFISEESWQASEATYEELVKAWDHVLFRIQFSVDKDIVFAFEDLLALLKGSIIAKSNQLGIIYCEALQKTWESLDD